MSDSRERAKQRKAEAIAKHRPEEILQEAQSRVEIRTWNQEPLKQYVRRVAWEEVISNFIRKLRTSGINRPWKYFTFPGPDALDIALLHTKGLLDNTPEGKLSVAICDRDHADKVALRLEKYGGVLASSEKELHLALVDHSNVLVKE